MIFVRFPPSLRNIEDLQHERGIEVSHETLRFWCNRFGTMLAAEIRRRRVDRTRAHKRWRWHRRQLIPPMGRPVACCQNSPTSFCPGYAAKLKSLILLSFFQIWGWKLGP